MSDMVSNGYLRDKNGKAMEIVDKAARDGVERLTEEIADIKENGTGSGSGLPEVNGPNRQLITDGYGVVKWVDGGIKHRLMTRNQLILTNPRANRYIYNFMHAGIIEGETYNFRITPVSGFEAQYEAIETETTAVAEITYDRFGNAAYEFNFNDIPIYKEIDTGENAGILKSLTFNADYVFVETDGIGSVGYDESLNILTDVPTAHTAFSNLVVWSSTADSTKRFKITVDDSGTLSATEVT